MVDAVQYLTQQNYRGNIHIFSRHGLIPLPHSEHHAQEATAFNEFKFSASDLTSAQKIVRSLRKQIAVNTHNEISWQTTINLFRTQINRIWLSLPERERKRLQRFLPWWNIARHRIPAVTYNQIIQLQKEEKIRLTKGDVKKAESDGEYFLLKLNNKTHLIQAEKMVICSGYHYDYEHLTKLCGDLLYSKEQVQQQLNNHQQNHKLSAEYSIYALGPSLAGTLFETTAIHEIRQQSKSISADIAL
jgi:uncharacterized NAD(P)/FAD-binding protein YdhS